MESCAIRARFGFRVPNGYGLLLFPYPHADRRLSRIVSNAAFMARQPIACFFRRHGAGAMSCFSVRILKLIVHFYLRYAVDPEIGRANVRDCCLGGHTSAG